jgi:hypothetical protein
MMNDVNEDGTTRTCATARLRATLRRGLRSLTVAAAGVTLVSAGNGLDTDQIWHQIHPQWQ